MKQWGQRLLAWYDAGHRDLPWRDTRDPYAIVVSEIMLQQTRAETAVPYYLAFLRRFPSWQALSASGEGELLKAWEGLGYYSRARNLQRLSREVVRLGELPRRREELLRLPGIGPYTSAAVAAIAFGEPVVAVDGNVKRVMARFACIRESVDSREGAGRVEETATGLLDEARPGDFANALMELGACVCTPRHPRCGECPLERGCRGRGEGRQEALPVKRKKAPPVRVEKTVLLVLFGRQVAVRRSGDGMLQGMYLFPELPGHLSPEEAACALREKGLTCGEARELGSARHVFTHRVWEMRIIAMKSAAPGPWRLVTREELMELPMPAADSAARSMALALLQEGGDTGKHSPWGAEEGTSWGFVR